jgi:hypothetical protein
MLSCVCGEFVLVIDKALRLLPRRRTDGAYILRNIDGATGAKKRTYKLNVNRDSKAVLIRRGEDGSTTGLEKQYRLRCTRCDLPLGYDTLDPLAVKRGLLKPPPYTFLFSGALTETQSAVPADAYDLDPGRTLRESLAAAEAEAEANEGAAEATAA